jgi:EAL domain-containing protein (putative c-di-GMP-specific phosphodiesterase class I)
VLTELKQLGMSLALDDFGTGYSSLAYLKRFPVDAVKIDQSFIADLPHNASSHAIVSKTIEMAHLLDLIVVCEGVETEAQHRVLTELGSDFCQGFYFARPMGVECLEAQMKSRTSLEPCSEAWSRASEHGEESKETVRPRDTSALDSFASW